MRGLFYQLFAGKYFISYANSIGTAEADDAYGTLTRWRSYSCYG
jgi:hypothetical protein